ncbi:MAG: PhoH family protein [Bacteroidales bacterium]|jgi:phosphate starvation-inducible PhoH-like protein|nr:PhoH family protein [Bacteroidales bacterium]MBO7256081.1 PhoH family protein [Bacteroidales bacterium]MBO7284365.1 PhoH family protein [Bacteroidales bacterium]MBO7322533.1 PhoH family protein [Bacteroidales bacterium]MBQ5882373.1 PhoH family protein [Bacteroidales bacterium]
MENRTYHITLEGIDPVEVYGANNRNLEMMSNFFPAVRIHARGADMKLSGDDNQVEMLAARIETLIGYIKRKQSLSESEIEKIFNYKEFASDVMEEDFDDQTYTIVYGNGGRVIKARTKNQRKLIKEYDKNDLIFAIGPAGTGKTYTAIALAVRALKNKEVKKLILTRPAVEAGERLGFLPGDMKEKLDPYLQPLYDALRDMIDHRKLAALMEEGIIQIAPLAYMRGRTLDSAFVILDEAQNTSIGQLKMFLTRMGCNAKFIVTGDATQIDLPNKKDSGLLRGVEIVKDIKGVAVINFGREDIVRHPLVSKIIKAFDEQEIH